MTEPIISSEDQSIAPNVRTASLSIAVPRDQFWGTVPVYATFPMISFDGANVHIALLSTAPSPVPEEDGDLTPVTVSARVIMPLESAEGLAHAILDVTGNPVPSGPLKGFFAGGSREPREGDN